MQVSVNENDTLFEEMKEAWDVSTAGYAFVASDGKVVYCNEYSAELFGSAATAAELEVRFSHMPVLGSVASRLTLAPGTAIEGHVECIPVRGGKWILFRLPEEVPAENLVMSAIMESSESLVVAVDSEGRFVRFNRAAEVATGYTAQEVQGRRVSELFSPDEDALQVQDQFVKRHAAVDRSEREVCWKVRDGSYKWILWTKTVLRDRDGKCQYVVATGVDQTERHHCEEALRSLSGLAFRELQGERSTTSRFLHDTVSQDLVALSFSFSRLQQNPQTAAGAQVVAQSLEVLDRCCKDVRILSYLLAPPHIEDIGLIPSIEWYGGQLQRESGMNVDLELANVDEMPTAERQAALFSALQNCVARSIRKMDRSAKRVTLRSLEGELRLRYDSLSYATARPAEEIEVIQEEFALVRERLRQLNGSLKLEPGAEGMHVTAVVPVKERELWTP